MPSSDIFIILTLDEGNHSFSCPSCFTPEDIVPCTPCTKGKVSTRPKICIRWWVDNASLLLSGTKSWSSSLSPGIHYIQWAILAPQITEVDSFWDNLLSWESVLNLWDVISVVVWTFHTQCVRIFTIFIQHHCSPSITSRSESKMKMSLPLIYHFTLNKNNATTIVHIHQNYISINNFMTLYIISSLIAHVIITNCRKWTGARFVWPLEAFC